MTINVTNEEKSDQLVVTNDIDESEFIGLELVEQEEEDDESSFHSECDGEIESSSSEAEMEELPAGAYNQHAGDEITQLRQWAMESNIPQTHLDKLLAILRKRMLPDLPASSKTFLKTSLAEYNIQKFKKTDGTEIGEFVYFGIAKHLQRCVNPTLHKDNCLSLQINMDGLPLFRSSFTNFWPILCKVHHQPDVYEPFPVAVYAGNDKPYNLEQYLGEFIKEMNELLLNGIIIDGQKLDVHIHCFICDTPARAFVKCVKNHGGYYACERCTVQGERYQNRTTYASTTCEERSDRSFRNQENPEHHRAVTPLISIILGLNLVLQFVLDFMHLCCLGIMKKMLVEFWLGNRDTTTTTTTTTDTTTTNRSKLGSTNKLLLSQLLLCLQTQIPSDFQRTTRSIDDISKWKATEFRFFLLYAGPIVLKKVLAEKLYKHFLLFHVACRILCSKDLAQKFNDQAKIYLTNFVKLSRLYYGLQSQVMNMHNLIHLADDAKNMKCSLSEVTAFPFENMLGKLKKLLRSGNRPLAQLCRRLYESFFANVNKAVLPPEIVILRKHKKNPTGIIRVKKLKYKEALFSTHTSDNTVLLQNGKILRIDDIYMQSDENLDTLQITGVILRIKKPIFTYPCDSAILKMWEITDGQKTRVSYSLKSIETKMVTLSVLGNDLTNERKVYTMPLLHV